MEPLRQWWSGQARETRIAIVGGSLALVVLLFLGFSLLVGGEDSPAVAVSVSKTPTIDPNQPGPTHTAEPLPTEDPNLPTLEALRDFVKQAGDPPNANIGRFKIPRIGV